MEKDVPQIFKKDISHLCLSDHKIILNLIMASDVHIGSHCRHHPKIDNVFKSCNHTVGPW